jgi:hypothetical protein
MRQALAKKVTRALMAEVQNKPETELTDAQLDLEREKQKLFQENERFRAEMLKEKLNRDLKKSIATKVFNFLAIETVLVLLIVIMHGLTLFGFRLEEWSLNIFITATIAQISAMAVIITRHLFPTDKKEG